MSDTIHEDAFVPDADTQKALADALAALEKYNAAAPPRKDNSTPIQLIPDSPQEQPPVAAVTTGTLASVVKHVRCGIKDTRACVELEHLITLNVRGMKVPYGLYAEIATLTVFGGLFGRQFKTLDGLSSALMMLLGAPTGSGKGEAFEFWLKQMARNTLAPNKPNYYRGSAASAQGLHQQIQDIGTTVWVRPDASADIQLLASPSGQTQTALRDYIYELFDASALDAAAVHPIASVESTKRGAVAIDMACVSMLWSTTPEGFRNTYSQNVLSTGLGSRMLVTIHDAPAGDSIADSAVVRNLSGTDNQALVNILNQVTSFDILCATDLNEAKRQTVIVGYSAEASALLRQVEIAVDGVRRGVDSKKLPSHYAVFARTAMQTKKVALTSALVRNRFKPRIEYSDVAYPWGRFLTMLVRRYSSRHKPF